MNFQRVEAHSYKTIPTLADRINGIVIFQSPGNYQKRSFVNSFVTGPPVTIQSLYIVACFFEDLGPSLALPNGGDHVLTSPRLTRMNRYIFRRFPTLCPTRDSACPESLGQVRETMAKPGVSPSLPTHGWADG